jgi:beta-glucosidase
MTFDRRWEENPAHDTYYPKSGDKKVAYTEGVFVGYRGYDKSGVKPVFPFGYGLSYTSFAYKNLAVTPSTSADQPAEVHFEVTNTGNRPGAEVAQVYVGERHSSVPRPQKELKGFAKVSLSPGETRQVTLKLDRRAFAYYDVKKHDWKVEPGDFDVYVARSAAQIELTGKVAVKAP